MFPAGRKEPARLSGSVRAAVHARLFAQTVKGGIGSDEFADKAEWCLEAMAMTLNRGDLRPADFTTDTFMTKKNGRPAWCALACGHRFLVEHMLNVANNLGEQDPDLAGKLKEYVLAPLASPAGCILFPRPLRCSAHLLSNITVHFGPLPQNRPPRL